MTTPRVRWLLLCVVGIASTSLVPVSWAKDELPKAVRNVLLEESQLSRSDWNRRQQLGEELVKAKSCAEERRWQAGFVKLGGNWLPFENSIFPEPNGVNEREYLERRAKTIATPEAQASLASWCSQQNLVDRSQAHNLRAIMLTPSDSDVSKYYRRMHYVRAGKDWQSPLEFNDLRREVQQYSKQLEEWAPGCRRLLAEFETGRLNEKTLSGRLSGFASNPRIPALETVVGYHSEASAFVAIQTIKQIPTYQATQALGRIAVFSPWVIVRDRACESLRERRQEDYVPQCLDLLQTPVQTQFQRLVSGPNLAFVFTATRENKDVIEVARNVVQAPGGATPAATELLPEVEYLAKLPPLLQGSFAAPTPRELKDSRIPYWLAMKKRLATIAATMEELKFQNDEIEFLNDRVTEMLTRTTGKAFDKSLHLWWDWWQKESGFSPIQEKRVIIVHENAETHPAPQGSCLVAGTPVWTERGLAPVERIQPGDRVLAKNIDTGELACKVVLHTTVREPVPVTKFQVGEDTIHASSGHHFWVSGSGWRKTRELAADQPLHTATGAARITSLESAGTAPVYNLVVADFHTYFVGKSAILSHDVLPPKPTNKTVPGLDEN